MSGTGAEGGGAGDAGGASGGEVPAGTILGARYRIAQRVGGGGMASVYRATDPAGQVFAIKVMHSHLVGHRAATLRFEREARVGAGLRHPNVVAVLDSGLTDAGASFLVMEHVPGRRLADALQSESPFTLARGLHIAAKVLAGLAAIHARGVVHRDIKPGNILLGRGTAGETVKISDLGVAAWIHSRASDSWVELTPEGRIMGTPRYAAPERLLGERGRDPRVDLYGVGVLLFEMLTGQPPFREDAPGELFDAILREAPPPLRAFRRDAPPQVEDIVRRALQKRAEDRFEDASQMRRAIEAALQAIDVAPP